MSQITFILKADGIIADQIYIVGACNELGFTEENALPMMETSEGWVLTVNVNRSNIRYSYFYKIGEVTRQEPWMSRKIELVTKQNIKIAVIDKYGVTDSSKNILNTKVFTEAVCHHATNFEMSKKSLPAIFSVTMPNLLTEHELCLIGDQSQWGKWKEDEAMELSCAGEPYMWCVAEGSKLKKTAEYKYVIRDKKTKAILAWEDGDNRRFKLPKGSYSLVIVNDGVPNFHLPEFKGSGVAIPVFSLRTKKSFGCGEFADLKPFADLAKAMGLRIIQTLPINDTTSLHTWKDSYPYSAISTFALHPMYISIEECGEVPNKYDYDKMRNELNSLETVDYEKVMEWKMSILQTMFERDKEEVLKSKEFKAFYDANMHWLRPYAAFSYLRDKFGTCETAQWGDYANYTDGKMSALCDKQSVAYPKITFYYYLQFHLDRQLKKAVAYCHRIGIALKGDIPIGMDLNSVDVWQYPKLFDCNGSAGAPPDDFSIYGQNWGFPIYNWKEMQKDDYSWWRTRFSKMSDYFDAYRIDHILGFFRIFRIPKDCVWGLLGQFAPALPMTKEEIESFGIEFDEEKYCEPNTDDEILRRLFGGDELLVKQKYLVSVDGKYKLRKEVDTQRKIKALLPYSTNAEKKIRDGLMSLLCQVLFVRDYQDPTKYHPRITVQNSEAYAMLDPHMRDKINRLYNYFYFERHNSFWAEQAMEKLPTLVHSTTMMCCGEDLGMVPACVPEVMDKLGILSLEIQRMPKEFNVEFGHLEKTPYRSVCTTSTHDMSTMRAWWEEDKEKTQRYFNDYLHEYGDAPLFCEPWVCEKIIASHLESPAMWVILPLQDWMSLDGNIRWEKTFKERINDPGNPDNYWCYRMHKTVEELCKDKFLCDKIAKLNKKYGR
ncbi:MAG: 4-alpha-glucanotransferase [Bacteroidales bacterium]|jgi:4-alpha-glucanotransferase|nr:4-alpha-glucanotransferase [Bacteroidales bacterium]